MEGLRKLLSCPEGQFEALAMLVVNKPALVFGCFGQAIKENAGQACELTCQTLIKLLAGQRTQQQNSAVGVIASLVLIALGATFEGGGEGENNGNLAARALFLWSCWLAEQLEIQNNQVTQLLVVRFVLFGFVVSSSFACRLHLSFPRWWTLWTVPELPFLRGARLLVARFVLERG